MKLSNFLIFKYFNFYILAAAMLLVSCEDFLTIYPTDKTTGKDYWKKKEHVDEMVAGAFKSMVSADAEEHAIMWGIFRSDDVTKSENYTNNDMEYVSAVNLYPSQGFCKWDVYYNVINRCNQVLAHAKDVMELDPEFTEGDFEVAQGQMLALRSLAYFYLVRAFRDVPYTGDVAFEGDEQVVMTPQSPPYDVLQHCIDDLETASDLVMKSGAYGEGLPQADWRDYGYFTQDACWTLLADIYLWRASMTGDKGDYEKVVEYAERVIESKDSYFRRNFNDRLSQLDETDRYHLYKWTGGRMNETLMSEVFVEGNSRESILEFQYSQNSANSVLCRYLFRSPGNKYSYLMASQIFNMVNKDKANTTEATKAFYSEDDYRFWGFLYDVNDENLLEQNIRKYATRDGSLPRTLTGNGDKWADGNYRSTDNFAQNWIVYRLTDLMLMEAEALVQLATADDDPQLDKAFELVEVVNTRSMKERSRDLLTRDKFTNKDEMEQLVLSERQRELCFECKRWFDLSRFAYRHMEGVDAHSIMADHEQWPALPKSMVALAARSYASGGEIFVNKMVSEPFLYWPIHEEEVKVNSELKQNPVFIQTEKSIRQ